MTQRSTYISGMLAVIATAVSMLFCAAPASADEIHCETVTVFGLHPQNRSICDGPIQPDGSWTRSRQFWHKEYVRSSCDGDYYQGGYCPPWLQRDVVPAGVSPEERYIVTADTIPPGEPGHLG